MLGVRPQGLPDSVFIHPFAFVESAEIGAQTRIWPFAHVMKGVRIGERCNVGEHVFLESGVCIGNNVTIKNGVSLWEKIIIEDDVFLGPHAIFTNDLKPRAFLEKKSSEFLPTKVKKGATVGAGAIIICGVTVGAFAFIAAGAVVTKDVPPYGLVKGNPARLTGYICACTKKIFSLDSNDRACEFCGALKETSFHTKSKGSASATST